MADYYAVLNRTLSGFGDANAQLRTKLYERARLTIRSQLDNRKPPMDEAATAEEMRKLEDAIHEIEQNFGGEVETSSPAANFPPTPPAHVLKDKDEPGPKGGSKENEVSSVPPAKADPDAGSPAKKAADAEPLQASSEKPKDILAEILPKPKPKPVDPAPPIPVFEPKVETPGSLKEAGSGSDDSIKEAIGEFQKAEVERVAPRRQSVPDNAGSAVDYSDPAAFVEPIAPPEEPKLKQAEPLPEVDFNGQSENDGLIIPPPSARAAGTSGSGGFGRLIKWFVIPVVLLGLLVGGWLYRGEVLGALGLGEFFDDPVRPNPVKTIQIKPEPEASGAETRVDEPTAAPAPEPEAEEPAVPVPKLEERLTGDGEPVQTEEPAQTELSAQDETSTDPAESNDATPKTKTGAQTAILYEEGAGNDKNVVDAGTVTWSVVQESPAADQPKEAAIRGQVEIPGRKAVLIMTIKRNTDPALTASHLIELIFAVPDDFSGGAIDTINRFVLKENEQARGDTLNAVPVKISDGIFLIALDNLPAAQTKNENLLKNRDWIDIPLQYRTGRRALVTMQKGADGAKVFDDVFKVWAEKAK